MAAGAGTWAVVAGLALGPAVANGFARFAYGLLLPSMRTDLGWSFTQAGWINTANALGYLAGAVLALSLIGRLGARRLFIGGLGLTALSLILSGLTQDFWALSAWRILAGIGGAPVFIAGGALASALFAGDERRSALAVALYFGGGGLGMLICGVALPALLARFGAPVWPEAWLMLGAMAALAAVPAWRAARLVPGRMGGAAPLRARLPFAAMAPALFAYFLFGLGYTIYVTFLIAWMRADGAGWPQIGLVWSVMGAMVMASPFLWRGVLARADGGGAIAATMLASGAGVAAALLFGGPAGFLASAALFGASFFMVPTATTTFGRRNLAESRWGASLALFTVFFSLGQIIGPIAAGALADRLGGVEEGMIASAAILLLGAASGAAQRRLPRP